MPLGKRLLFSAITGGLFCVIALVLFEVGIRVAAPQPQTWLNIYRPYPAIASYHLIANLDVFVTSGLRYRVRTDERGHRVASDAVGNRSPREIWFVGDSYTFGQGSSYEDSFPGQVAEKFAGIYAVENLGVGGWGPVQYLADLEYNLDKRPPPAAIIVTSYLGNDYFDCIWDKNLRIRDGVLNDPGGFKSFVKRHSHLYRALSAIYHRYAPAKEEYSEIVDQMAHAQHWESGELARAATIYEGKFRELAELSRQRGIPMLAVLVPTRESVANTGKESRQGLDYGLVMRRTKAMLEDAGIRYIDLTGDLAAVGADKAYQAFDGHFSPKGNAVAAQAMIRWLSEATGVQEGMRSSGEHHP
jgi:hypothetical protein